MAAVFQLNTADLARQLRQLNAAGGHAASSTVQLWAKRMVKKLAYQTNIAKVPARNKGRLRAGWYPAANTLHAGGVYSGTYRDHGEGFCWDFSKDPQNPQVIMGNSVKFWPWVDGLMESLQAGIDQLTARAKAEMEGDFSRFAAERFSLR